MDEMKKDMGMGMNHGAACSCGSCGMMGRNMCGMCGGRRFWALRWLLGLVILAIVFTLGVKIGEFKGYFESGFGGSYYGQMSHHGMMREMMMQGENEMYPTRIMMTQPANSAPATSVTPVK